MNYIFVGNSHLDALQVSSLGRVIYKAGASIKGLQNDASATGLNIHIRNEDKGNKNTRFVFCLGQVDIEFGYFYKCVKENSILDSTHYNELLVSILKTFLQSLQTQSIVIGVRPTVIENVQQCFRVNFQDTLCHENNRIQNLGEFQNITFESVQQFYQKSIQEINSILFDLHMKMKTMCKENNICYINLWEFVSTDTNEVKKEFKAKHEDYHLIAHPSLHEFIKQSLIQCENQHEYDPDHVKHLVNEG